MLNRIVLTTAIALASIMPTLATADLVAWGDSGPWKIMKDSNHGDGCVAQTALSDGSFLRIGFEKKGAQTGYIASYNPAWTSINGGTKYDITVKFADQSFVGEGRGDKFGDMPGIVVAANNLNLLEQLAKADSVNLSADGGDGLTIALNGSNDAVQKALACQAE